MIDEAERHLRIQVCAQVEQQVRSYQGRQIQKQNDAEQPGAHDI